MATVVIGLLNHTSLDACEVLTNWSGPDTLDADFAKENTYAVTGALRADLTSWYTDYGSAPVTAAGKHLRLWLNTINKAYMEPESGGGYELYMYDGTTTQYITIFGSDTYDGGWINIVIDCALYTSLTLANVQRWGIRANHTGTARNIDNTWLDYVRYLDGYYITGGTSGDEVDLNLVAARDVDDGAGTLRGYGVVLKKDGVYFCTGKFNVGNSTTTTYFKMDGEVLAFVENDVAADFHEFSAAGTAANIEIKDSTILAAGTSDDVRFVFDMSAAASLDMAGTVLNRAAAVTFIAGQDVLVCTFNDCRQITHGGADLTGSVVKNYEGTANTSALIYNVAADPDGEMDGMTFEKGTAATHAIEFGLTSPLTMTLRDLTCTGYNASDTQNDSTFHFKRTSGTVTVNLIGFTGNYSYRTDGATISFVVSPVTVKVHVDDNTGTELSGVQVWMKAADATGELPFQQAITSITRAGTLATVTFTAAHGLKTNDYLDLGGITDKTEDNWGAHQVTVTGSTTLTYVTTDSGSTSYTGTIIGTGGLLYGTTDVNGDISISRSFTGLQNVAGFIAKSTASPRFKRYPLAGNTVNNLTGLTVNARLILDE